MAENEIHIDAAPEAVFALLADGQRYADWVVGAKYIRSVEPGWPAPGSRFHHTIGIGPIEIKDNTVVTAVDAPRRLVLEARLRPIGRARIDLEIEPDGDGCKVRMTEEPVRVPTVVKRLLDPPILARNAEALRRLRELVEQPDG